MAFKEISVYKVYELLQNSQSCLHMHEKEKVILISLAKDYDYELIYITDHQWKRGLFLELIANSTTHLLRQVEKKIVSNWVSDGFYNICYEVPV